MEYYEITHLVARADGTCVSRWCRSLLGSFAGKFRIVLASDLAEKVRITILVVIPAHAYPSAPRRLCTVRGNGANNHEQSGERIRDLVV